MSRLDRTLTALDHLVPILKVNEQQRVRISSRLRNTRSGGWRGTRLDQISSLRWRSHNSLEVTHLNEDIYLAGLQYQFCQTQRGSFLSCTAITQTENRYSILTNWGPFHLNTFSADCLLRIDTVHCQTERCSSQMKTFCEFTGNPGVTACSIAENKCSCALL